jgi:DNA-binding CsgD family transcriptional regulator
MQRISEHEILSAVGSFYEAAQKASRDAWVDVWRQLKAMFRSGTGGFSFYDTRTDQFTALISDADPDLIRDYTAKYQDKSRIRKEVAKLKAGERFSRKDLFTDEEFLASDIYEAFYEPAGIFHFEYQVFLVRPGMHGGVSFSRGLGEPDFDEHELAVMKLLLPHLERAFQLYAGLLDTELEGRVMSAAFDRISRNVIVTDRNLEVAFANGGARELLAEHDGLNLDKDGFLTAATSEQTARLATWISKVCESNGEGPGEAILLPDPNGRRPLEVLCARVASDHLLAFSEQPLVLLFVTDPEQSAPAVDDVLIQMYGLTPAEARIAALLAEVNELKTVCRMLGIKESTGRTHLKRIFSKTDTNKQSALVKLVLSGSASIQ